MALGIGGGADDWLGRKQTMEEQIFYLCRFVHHLYNSDAPKDTKVSLYPPHLSIYETRSKYLGEVAKESDFVLMTDADMIVPEVWWSTAEKIFAEYPQIGYLMPLMNGNGYCDPRQTQNDAHPVGQELTIFNTEEVLQGYQHPAFFDGFVIFRSEVLRNFSYQDNPTFRIECLKAEWFAALTHSITVCHLKGPWMDLASKPLGVPGEIIPCNGGAVGR